MIAATFNSFRGDMTSEGGEGISCGASGTVYLKQNDNGVLKHSVMTDNGGKTCRGVYTIAAWKDLSVPFHLNIRGGSSVKFQVESTPNQPLQISYIDGDYTGVLVLQDQQYARIATSYGTQHAFALKCKLEAQKGSMVTLPSKLLLTDLDSSDNDSVSLNVSGRVLGLSELVVANGGQAFFSLDSQNGIDSSRIGAPGSLLLTSVYVTHGGTLMLGLDRLSLFSLQVLQELDVEFGAKIMGRFLTLVAPSASIAFGGEVTSTGQGQPPRKGGVDGGSHGGNGGSTSLPVLPDTLFNVSASGQGGNSPAGNEDSKGGGGGGFIRISVDNTFTLHGVISSSGGEGVNGGSGGAGGSVVIVTENFLGEGQVQVAGGDGDTTSTANSAGGGGGGRIYVDIKNYNNFTGSYITHGGSSLSQAGGAGTALVNEFRMGFLNLFISNTGADGSSFAETVLDLVPGTTTFTNLILGQNVQLEISTPNLYFIAQEISCEQGTTVFIHDKVIFSADVNKNETRLACSFDVSEQAELRLPNTVELLGARNRFDGRFY